MSQNWPKNLFARCYGIGYLILSADALMTESEIRTAIAEIDERLNSGVSSVQRRDYGVSYDIPALERRRAELVSLLAARSGSSFRRVVFRRG